MVRVITVHNFLGQNITQIEEPTTTCLATTLGREMLLLALATHCVEVWELTASSLKLHTIFPTVDMINQMVHCARGDYVATLETKLSRESLNNYTTKASYQFVRIYVNWAIEKDQSQPMRARIAGRVTPSLNRPLNSLEMIELPLNANPTSIACCQSTGNLLVCTGSSAIIHEFKIETQQLSKLKFIDFEARPWSLGFQFAPTRMEIVEDIIAIMDSSNICIFKLVNSMYEDINQISTNTPTNSSSIDKTSISTDSSLIDNSNHEEDQILITKNKSHIVKKHDSEKEKPKTCKNSKPNVWHQLENAKGNKLKTNGTNNCINWNRLIYNEREETTRLISQEIIQSNSQPLTYCFPSVSLERASPGHAISPFALHPLDTKVIIKTTSPDLGWSENYMIKNLLYLKISSISNNITSEGNSEMFTCLVLKPLYLKGECNTTHVKKSFLRSDKYKKLQGVSCILCTAQEGYLYHFSTIGSNSLDVTCLTTYPFTAPVNHVALEHTALHALTEAGLESYTLRLSHHVAKYLDNVNDYKITCPNISEPVCLVGLRPFLGVEKLLHSKNYIILLAKAERSWTLYSLILPKLEHFYFDILNAAKIHKTSSPSTYRHLLGEAHAIMRLANKLDDNDKENDGKLKNLYNQSCALLGDYYIRSESESDWNLCIPYYKMSGLKPSQVLSRKSSQDAPGLVSFLTDILLSMKSGPETDALFQGQNIIEIISKLKKKHLLQLIFGSSVLREYTTDKLINLLLTLEIDDPMRIALGLLYIQVEKQEEANVTLEFVSERCIKSIVIEYWNLLFDVTAMKKKHPMIPTFSEFAETLMCQKPTTFAQILIYLIEEDKVLTLHQIIQVFMEYLPSRVGRDGYGPATTLQIFIEKYLESYIVNKSLYDTSFPNNTHISSDFAIAEAFKLLIRSYLSRLTKNQLFKTNDQKNEKHFVFAKYRPAYLNQLPPYVKDCDKDIYKELFKLQSVLAYPLLSVECFHEVKQFLETNDIDGGLSLKILCNSNIEEVTKTLLDQHPKSVIQYAKDIYTKDCEWKCLIDLTQNKISTCSSENESYYLYSHIMKEILNYLPHVLPMKSLHQILPKDDRAMYQKYTEICNQVLHADHVKSLIMETGQQLLSTLKL